MVVIYPISSPRKQTHTRANYLSVVFFILCSCSDYTF